MQTAMELLAVPATGDLALASMRLGSQVRPPAWMSVVVEIFSIAALCVLIHGSSTVGLPVLAYLALLLILVEITGILLLDINRHFKLCRLPKWVVLGHSGSAFCGFLLLIAATWKLSLA